MRDFVILFSSDYCDIYYTLIGVLALDDIQKSFGNVSFGDRNNKCVRTNTCAHVIFLRARNIIDVET